MTISSGTLARRQKVQSAEVGLEMLKALARLAPSASLSAVAEAADMPASKAHRYLKALIASGFANQDPSTGRYGLGPEALSIGLAALGRVDVVAAAVAPLSMLNAELNHTCFLAVWANRGATVVLVREAARAVTVVTRIGSVLPLLVSATGLTFAAYLSPDRTEDMAALELAELAVGEPRESFRAAAEARIAQTRELGLCLVRGLYHPGVDAIAAPVFGPTGAIVGVLTILGPTTSLDLNPQGHPATSVRAAARATSTRIGYRAEASEPHGRGPSLG